VTFQAFFAACATNAMVMAGPINKFVSTPSLEPLSQKEVLQLP
jgi:hypothetical protein